MRRLKRNRDGEPSQPAVIPSVEPSPSAAEPSPSAAEPSPSEPASLDAYNYVPPINQKVGKNNKGWNVKVIKECGARVPMKLKNSKQVWSLPRGHRIELAFNGRTQPKGDVGGLIPHFLAILATDYRIFPISFASWKTIPQSYKDKCWDIIKSKFVINYGESKRWIEHKLNKIWRDKRWELFKKYYKFERSREVNIDKHCPPDIPKDHWALFVDYRLRPETLAMSEQNTANREKLLIPHTSGSKSFVRKEEEMEIEGGGIHVTRAALYDATHKKKDGSYITEEARINSEKMAAIESQGLASQSIGPQDAFGQVMGPEHPGRVRGLGLGPVPSRVFGSFTHGASGSTNSSESTIHLNKIAELQAQLKAESEKVKLLQNCVHHIYRALPNVTPPSELAVLLNPEDNLDDTRPSSSSSHAPPPSR